MGSFFVLEIYTTCRAAYIKCKILSIPQCIQGLAPKGVSRSFLNYIGLVRSTSIAAVSLFWNTNMVAMTSFPYAPLKGTSILTTNGFELSKVITKFQFLLDKVKITFERNKI